jgi:hypothetical protein
MREHRKIGLLLDEQAFVGINWGGEKVCGVSP